MKLYDHPASCNCLKCRIALRQLGVPFETVADIAPYGYVHCAADAGADPRRHGHVRAWLDRVEGTSGFVNDLGLFPAHVVERPI